MALSRPASRGRATARRADGSESVVVQGTRRMERCTLTPWRPSTSRTRTNEGFRPTCCTTLKATSPLSRRHREEGLAGLSAAPASRNALVEMSAIVRRSCVTNHWEDTRAANPTALRASSDRRVSELLSPCGRSLEIAGRRADSSRGGSPHLVSRHRGFARTCSGFGRDRALLGLGEQLAELRLRHHPGPRQLGRHLFFLLSGFLLADFFWSTPHRTAREFYVRRFFRIAPAYYVCVGILALFFAQHALLFSQLVSSNFSASHLYSVALADDVDQLERERVSMDAHHRDDPLPHAAPSCVADLETSPAGVARTDGPGRRVQAHRRLSRTMAPRMAIPAGFDSGLPPVPFPSVHRASPIFVLGIALRWALMQGYLDRVTRL